MEIVLLAALLIIVITRRPFLILLVRHQSVRAEALFSSDLTGLTRLSCDFFLMSVGPCSIERRADQGSDCRVGETTATRRHHRAQSPPSPRGHRGQSVTAVESATRFLWRELVRLSMGWSKSRQRRHFSRQRQAVLGSPRCVPRNVLRPDPRNNPRQKHEGSRS